MYIVVPDVFVFVNGEIFLGNDPGYPLSHRGKLVYWNYRKGKRRVLRPICHAHFDPETRQAIFRKKRKPTPEVCYLLDEYTPRIGQRVRVHYYNQIHEGKIEDIGDSHFAITTDGVNEVQRVDRRIVSFMGD